MLMKISTLPLGLCLCIQFACSTSHVKLPASPDRTPLVMAIDIDPADRILTLRNQGPTGLEALLESNAALIAGMRGGLRPLDDPQVTALRTQIDQVARQRDAYASGLYWYTDLTAAKAEAARSHRHILSLRLLGNLDEEYSCANSRFFRTALYANTAVATHLRAHYVLHWQSVRPAPLVTIDMGDGRRIKRTITGNSIHYVLDADGSVLDALPGLYGPAAFLAALARSEPLSRSGAETVHVWHQRQADRLRRQWLTDAVAAELYGPQFTTRLNHGRDRDVAESLAEAFPARRVEVVPQAQGRSSAPKAQADGVRTDGRGKIDGRAPHFPPDRTRGTAGSNHTGASARQRLASSRSKTFGFRPPSAGRADDSRCLAEDRRDAS